MPGGLFAEARSGLRSDGMEDAGQRLTSSDSAYGSSAADTEDGAPGRPYDEDLTHKVTPPSLHSLHECNQHRHCFTRHFRRPHLPRGLCCKHPLQSTGRSLILLLYFCSDCHRVAFLPGKRAKPNVQNVCTSVIKGNALPSAARCNAEQHVGSLKRQIRGSRQAGLLEDDEEEEEEEEEEGGGVINVNKRGEHLHLRTSRPRRPTAAPNETITVATRPIDA
ncbi:hypothetical protein EYF80_006378 [Liparis tanakae]|uniref:Uncharacterized protein n=1 Tax=Liparis tanakae TaxID=230148 RepID=A0A4Z2J059_9TELE|nr:hypothetical protein EYF80_006378 [Liparis tanakae]